MLTPKEFHWHIEGCKHNQRASQKMIYLTFYGYAKSIFEQQYSGRQEDLEEILNDSFLKIFKHVEQFRPAHPDKINCFKGWLKKIVVNTAIDHYRKNAPYQHQVGLNFDSFDFTGESGNGLHELSYREIMRCIMELSPSYRKVLSLYIVEGYRHHEIAKCLGISIGTSKSNLSKARKQLQSILSSRDRALAA
jgi:RNA polymerase sigma factor (sigma-70 family)